jgi:hypothetical protein
MFSKNFLLFAKAFVKKHSLQKWVFFAIAKKIARPKNFCEMKFVENQPILR